MKKRQAPKPRRKAVPSTDLLSSIKGLAEYLDKAAEKARNKEPRDWSHDHGFQRGKAAAYTWAAKLARRCLDSSMICGDPAALSPENTDLQINSKAKSAHD